MSENVTEHESRGSFTGRIGFVMAAAASAVGLGNLWRFPWLTANYGGGMFVLVYIIIAVTFGFSLMVAEIALGRRTHSSCINAFSELAHKYRWIGVFTALIPLLIVPYYCVIGGWVTEWFAESVTGNLSTLTEDGFWWDSITTGMGGNTAWFLVFALLCIACVVIGVDRGIEKLSKILMPLLLIMMVAITVYELVAIDGIWDGVSYYLKPDLDDLSGGTFLGAVSQIFYSMSLAMGIMITYGSYMKKSVSIERSARNVSIIDTVVAIMAGLMIIPPTVAFTGNADASGMGLMFVTLPQVFDQMPGGAVVAPVFYLLVIFAALTSAVSLLETVVSVFIDLSKIRRKASIVVSSICLLGLGVIVVLGFGPLNVDLSPFDQGAGWLGFLDTLTNSIMMPIAAILCCVYIGYVVKLKYITDEVKSEGNEFRSEGYFGLMIKYVCPVLLALILVFGLLSMYGIFDIYA